MSSAPRSSPTSSSRAKVAPEEVDEVILGQILTAGQGQNPARQASIRAGVPKEATAWGLNQLCGSGLRAVALGMQQITSGDAEIIVAGGQELMSMAPHCAYLRGGVKMGDYAMIDTMIKDGLWDAFNGYHMGTTAENVARDWQITREMQDKFAVASQNKAESGAEGRQVQGRDRSLHGQDAEGRRRRRQGRIHPARHDARDAWQSSGPPSPRTARSRRRTPRGSTTAPRRSC